LVCVAALRSGRYCPRLSSLLLLLLAFLAPSLFLQSARPFLHLRSFPTRRSSDLPFAAIFINDCVMAIFLSTMNFTNFLVFNQNLDRKSTRLNSSHVSISYAVFCLKKKKHTTNN